MKLLMIFILFETVYTAVNDGHLGCYIDRLEGQFLKNTGFYSIKECKEVCRSNYYRYTLVRNKRTCWCTNSLGKEFSFKDLCTDVCENCSMKDQLSDVYPTGVVLPGPPQNLQASNITNSSVLITWKEPKSFVEIIEYEVTAKIIKTYSSLPISHHTFMYSNDTYSTELDVLPCTTYNISVLAISVHGKGEAIYKIIETLVGIPDNTPPTPIVLSRNIDKMVVQLHSVINNNGPTTAYQVAVFNEDMNQILQTENLKSYNEAMEKGLAYYIAAEIPPEDIDRHFTLGDGRSYCGFINAPLDLNSHYQVILGIVSRYRDITYVVWSNVTEGHGEIAVNILPLPSHNKGVSGIIIALSVGIVLLSILLIAGIIGFVILTRRVSNRRRRLTDNQELTMQGPFIEIENNGFIPEEEIIPVNHYENIKEQLWNISQSLLNVEHANVLGTGRFGRVSFGLLTKDKDDIPVAVYTIADRKLGIQNKRAMLLELDILLRSKTHNNVHNLIGICENPDRLFVVLEHISTNLKDMLLKSREIICNRFCTMQESRLLEITCGIANGMKHLKSLNIIHKQLCAYNVLITDDYIPKISGYGLAQYYNRPMDYTRWTAVEVLLTQKYVSKCDVWSFGVLFWEICALGGTPYASVSNTEIKNRLTGGLYLNQMKYISDDIYQLMLNCWQLDLDERPNFTELLSALSVIAQDKFNIHLNFNLYLDFQYEPYYSEMELDT